VKKRPHVLIPIVCIACFVILPIGWEHATEKLFGINDVSIDWGAWWAFGSFTLAVAAAYIAWREYVELTRPRLTIYLVKTEQKQINTGDTETTYLAEWVGLKLENIGKTPATEITITFSPGIPWPLGSHPAGDPQQKLTERRVSHLATNKSVDLLFAGRAEFDQVAFEQCMCAQTIHLSYRGLSNRHFEEELTLDLRDIAFLSTTAQ